MAKQPAERKPLGFEKYMYGALAGRLTQSKESSRYAPSALEILAGKKGLNLGEEALGFIRGTQASEEGIKTAINVYAGKFEEERGKYKPIDMAQWYDSILKDLDAGDKQKIVGVLGKYSETIGSIVKKFSQAGYITAEEAPEGLFTPQQIASAKATLEKYGEVLQVMDILDNYKFEELRSDAVSSRRKADLKGLASKL
jgi:hypothetical protein